MDAKRDAGILGFADVWDGLEPQLVEQALTLLRVESRDHTETEASMKTADPLEPIVRDRVLATIRSGAMGTHNETAADKDAAEARATEQWHPAQAPLPMADQLESPRREASGDRFPRRLQLFRGWQRSPYARLSAAVLVILVAVWILNLPILKTGTATATTAATTHAGITSAATTAAGATTRATTAAGTTAAAATTTAGTTAAATTTAGTTAAATTAGTTAATTAAGTTAATTAAGGMTWPIRLVQYLGFSAEPGPNGVQSVDIRLYRADGTLERTTTLTDRAALLTIRDLVGQIHLNQPLTAAPRLTGRRYELVFRLPVQSGRPVPVDPVLMLYQMADVNMVIVNGTFASAAGIKAPYGMVQTNEALTFSNLESRLQALMN